MEKDAIGVMRYGDHQEKLQQIFKKVDTPEPFHVYSDKNGNKSGDPDLLVKTLYLYRCYGFQGGLRWQSPRQDDIRVSAAGNS